MELEVYFCFYNKKYIIRFFGKDNNAQTLQADFSRIFFIVHLQTGD